MTPEQRDALRAPFPPEAIGKLPRAGVLLDYVGHAAVVDRLLHVDPDWTWEPVAFDDLGAPLVAHRGKDAVLWIRLTICGVTRYGVGIAQAAAFELEKQLISDAIRNGAMRFGVALDLWAKEDISDTLHGSAGGHDATSHATRVPQQGQARPGDTPSSPPAGPPPSDPRLAVIVDRCKADAEIAAYVKAHWDWPYRDEDLANITAWLAERDATADLEAMATPEPPKSVNRYAIAARHAGLDDDQRHQLVRHITSDAKSSSKDLTAAEGKQFLAWCARIERTGELPWGEIPTDLEPF